MAEDGGWDPLKMTDNEDFELGRNGMVPSMEAQKPIENCNIMLPDVWPHTMACDGREVQFSRNSINQLVDSIRMTLGQNKPWVPPIENDTKPDLSWHTPTCTDKDWRHLDVKLEIGPGIAYVILNRPDYNNTLNDTVQAALDDALFAMHASKDVRLVVFTGEGKMFCAGDPAAGKPEPPGRKIELQPQAPEVEEHMKRLGERALSMGAFPNGEINYSALKEMKRWHTWSLLPQFSIALVQGSAMGTGLGCMCCSDLIVAVKTAFFSAQDAMLATAPTLIAPYLHGKLGTKYYKNFLLFCETLSAERAREMHLVHEVVDSLKEGHALIRRVAESLTKCSPDAVRANKEVIVGVAGFPVNDSVFMWTSKIATEVNQTEAARQGLEARARSQAQPWTAAPICPLY